MRFVDSSLWIALQFRRDGRHKLATDLWRDAREPLVTSNLVVGETWTHLNRRLGHFAALDFLESVEGSSRTTIAPVGADDEREAWAWLRRHDERVYSFVDATSFVLMRRLGIAEALAFDGDFSAAGFIELRP